MKKTIFLFLFFIQTTIGLAQHQMILQVTIANRNGDKLFIKNQAADYVGEMTVNNQGIFKSSFALEEGLYYLFDGKRNILPIYLKKDSNLKIKFDIQNFEKSFLIKGKGANESILLNNQRKKRESIDYFDLVSNLDQISFDEKITELRAEFVEKMEKSKLSPKFIALQKETNLNFINRLETFYEQKAKSRKMKGEISPLFEYENYKGGKTKLEDLRGKYVYIDLWATWCGPCKAEIPFLQKIEEEYHGKNVEFVSISIDVAKDHDKWKAFVGKKKLGGVQLIADNDWKSDFVKSYNLTGIPRFILLDPTGKIVESDAPRPSNPKLKELLDSLLNHP